MAETAFSPSHVYFKIHNNGSSRTLNITNVNQFREFIVTTLKSNNKLDLLPTGPMHFDIDLEKGVAVLNNTTFYNISGAIINYLHIVFQLKNNIVDLEAVPADIFHNIIEEYFRNERKHFYRIKILDDRGSRNKLANLLKKDSEAYYIDTHTAIISTKNKTPDIIHSSYKKITLSILGLGFLIGGLSYAKKLFIKK